MLLNGLLRALLFIFSLATFILPVTFITHRVLRVLIRVSLLSARRVNDHNCGVLEGASLANGLGNGQQTNYASKRRGRQARRVTIMRRNAICGALDLDNGVFRVNVINYGCTRRPLNVRAIRRDLNGNATSF